MSAEYIKEREEYILKRLMELSFITDSRELEEIEKNEERELLKELEELVKAR